MDTKLILLDLDGTLLRSDKTISDFSARILNKAKSQNILIGFCTARGKWNVETFENLIRPDIVISNGGACVFYKEQILHKSEFSLDETKKILESAYKECGNDCEITLDTFDCVFWNRKADKSTDYDWNSVYDDFKNFKIPAMKICVQTDDEQKAKKIAQSVKNCDFLPFSDIPWYKFSSATATKENSIKILCEKLNFSTEKIIAFGDDFSDIGMLKICGKGIAMQNAIRQVKNIADDICKTNDEDGVARYIENCVLKK